LEGLNIKVQELERQVAENQTKAEEVKNKL
jgi:hypothetical protein